MGKIQSNMTRVEAIPRSLVLLSFRWRNFTLQFSQPGKNYFFLSNIFAVFKFVVDCC